MGLPFDACESGAESLRSGLDVKNQGDATAMQSQLHAATPPVPQRQRSDPEIPPVITGPPSVGRGGHLAGCVRSPEVDPVLGRSDMVKMPERERIFCGRGEGIRQLNVLAEQHPIKL
jgi:hypothetical protein